jgi:hypothetical protein
MHGRGRTDQTTQQLPTVITEGTTAMTISHARRMITSPVLIHQPEWR